MIRTEMSALRLLGNTLVIAPIKAAALASGIILPPTHRVDEPQQWRVLQVGSGRKTKKGHGIPIELVPGDVIVTASVFESAHEFSDGVRIVDASVALGRVENEGEN
jgi:co-chaperonin GroES (HSP10)